MAKRGMAQAIYGMGVIVGPTLGPPLEAIWLIIIPGPIFFISTFHLELSPLF